MNGNLVNRLLKWVGILGFIISIAINARSWAGADGSLFALAAIHVFAFVVVLAFLRRQSKTLFRNIDLLAPLGIYLLLNACFRLTGLPESLNIISLDAEAGRLMFADVTPDKALSWSYQLISGIFYVGWTMSLILSVIRGETVNLSVGLKTSVRMVFKVGTVLVFGWLAVVALTTFSPYFSNNAYIACVLLFCVLFTWNILTAPLVYSVFKYGDSLRAASLNSFRLAWQNRLKLFPIILLYCIFVGILTILPVAATHDEFQTGTELFQNTSFAWHTKGVWLGGFANMPGWFDAAINAYDISNSFGPREFIITLYSVIAIVIKIKLVEIFEAKGV